MSAPPNVQLTALLVDDELPNLENLSSLLALHCPWIRVVGTARNVRTAAAFLQEQTVDVVFLDIEMPNGNGFELLPQLEGKSTLVVFVTAHSRYALRALKASATDYLLKPIDIDELVETGRKLLAMSGVKEVSSVTKEDRYQALSQALQQPKVEKLILPQQRGFRLVSIASIIYLEGDNSYTTVYSTTDAPVIVSRTLKDFEQMLENEPGFFRIHKSYLVNLRHIQEFTTEDGGCVILPGKQQLPVSRRRLSDFMRVMKQNGNFSR